MAPIERPNRLANGRKTLKICSANSLVGVRISPVGRCGSASGMFWMRGKPKASVFPEPVGALQATSCPSSMSGMAAT